MKNLLIIIALALFSACTATSKLSKIGINYQEGDDLIYEVRTKDDDNDDLKYEIELNINGVEDYYVSYDWEVFAERSGTISMSENAINNATKLSFFEKTGYESLEDATTIWVSRRVFKALKSNEKIELELDERKEIFNKTGTETYSFGDRGNGVPYNIPVIIVANPDETIEFWIADDAKNPIIVMVSMKDFSMDLMDYRLFK